MTVPFIQAKDLKRPAIKDDVTPVCSSEEEMNSCIAPRGNRLLGKEEVIADNPVRLVAASFFL
jgi:hypothetical protein